MSKRKTAPKSVRSARDPLTRERIVDKTLEMIDRDGLAAFSTRKLGEELSVEAMSLYHHFPSKAHLFEACVDRIVASIPRSAHDDPYERLRALAVGWRDAAHRHPGFYSYLVVHRLNTEVGLSFLNALIEPLRAAGFDAGMTARLLRVLFYYMMGCGLDETSGYANGPSAVAPLTPEEERRRFPMVSELGPYFQRPYWDGHFAFGLDALIDMIRRAPRTLPPTT